MFFTRFIQMEYRSGKILNYSQKIVKNLVYHFWGGNTMKQMRKKNIWGGVNERGKERKVNETE